ncbi:PBP1A family penicillin-binding protein [candidate division KSB1 bacterium]|nr:PBP1A family penicillin-binding protein [candidate division KSB1 bacterium]
MIFNKKRIYIFSAIALILIFLTIFLLFVLTLPQLPEQLHDLSLSTPTEIYSDSGELIIVLANRQEVKLSQISSHFINALLAMEDTEFFKHHGLNKKGLLRAIFTHLITMKRSGGGSSITQQLAKNMYFSFDRSWSRKIKDALLACQIEERYSKNEILEAYCNQIDMGSNSYGIEQASQTYFAKHADELTLAEAAFLSNLTRWPTRYNPYRNYDIAKERQRIVLLRMRKSGFISQEEMDQANAEPLNLQRLNLFWGKASYFLDHIKNMVEKQYSPEVLSYGGLKIYTTLDTRLQNIAQAAVRDELAKLDERLGFQEYDLASIEEKKHYIQAALVSMDPRTGKVKAMVGGRDFSVSQFNRSISNNRQAGSSFKPFLFLAAIDQGKYTPASIVVDSAVTFEYDRQKWTPSNFDNSFSGPITIKTALSKSRNVVAAKVIFDITPERTVDYAKIMGIKSPLSATPSLALGTSGVSPLEMCSAYCPFANGGISREPLIIKYIENSLGNTLDEFSSQSNQVVDPQSIYLVLDMLREVVETGSGRSVRSLGFHRPAAGKTGTTNDARDAWFIAFTPELVTAVWVGFDDNRPIKDKNNVELSSAIAIPIWTQFLENALRGERYRNFPIPEGIIFVYVDPKTGEIVPQDFPGAQQVALKAGTELPLKDLTRAYSFDDTTSTISDSLENMF